MPDSPLTPTLARSLLASGVWRAYVTVLLEHFTTIEQRYDTSCSTYDQGLKAGLRYAIEYPYLVADQESPLTRKATDLLRTRRRPRKQVPEQETEDGVYLPVPARSSGLV